MEQTVSLLEHHMDNMERKSDDVARLFKNASTDLKTMVALSDTMEDALKGMTAQGKKFQQAVLKSKTWEDQRAAVKAMQEGFKQMAQQYASIPKTSAAAKRGLEDCSRILEEIKNKSGEMGDELVDSQKALRGLTAGFDHLARVVKGLEFGHMTRQIHGVSRALQAAGIGKGKTYAYATRGAELAANMREMKRSRIEENKSAFMAKRASVLADVEARYGKDAADPKRAEAMRKAMGISRFGRRMVASAEAAGGGAAAYGDMAEHGGTLGGYAMSRAAGTVESGIGMMGGAMAKAAPILAVLDLLRMAFDKTVEQNKAMEASLGKGGLFSAKAGSAGFMQARTALTPAGVGFTAMGLSFERNLKMAQAVVEGGYNIAELVTGERGKGPAGAQYMPGALGQFQQIAVGAGRVAGFSDQEGIQQIVKLLGQYRQTLSTSDDFFIRVARDSKAAGLSTAKYVQILDEVGGHFDRMNKSMSESVNVLRMLSRTGAVAGDSLQTMMDFFTQNPKTTFDTVAPKTFTAQQMGSIPGMRDAIDQAHGAALSAAIESANTALGDIPGMAKVMGSKDLAGKGMAGANSYLTEIQSQIGRSSVNETTKKNAREAIQLVRDNVNRMLGQRGGALTYATGESTFGSDLVNTMGDNITQMVSAGAMGAGGLANMMKGTMGANQRLALEGILQSVYGQGDFSKNLNAFQQSQRLAAADRIQTVQGSPEDAKKLVQELLKLQGFKAEFKTKGYTMSVVDAQKDSVKFLKENADKLAESVAYLKTTAVYQVKQAGMADKVTIGDKRQAELMGKVIGMQTQSSADIIAQAFSTWFNDIIGFLGKITMNLLKPSAADIAKTAAIFDDKKLQKEATRAQEVMSKRMEELAVQMASGKLTPEEFASAEEEYKDLGRKMDTIAKYDNADAKKTASLEDAREYERSIRLGEGAKAEADRRELMAQIAKVPGVTGTGAKTSKASEAMFFASGGRFGEMPGMQETLAANTKNIGSATAMKSILAIPGVSEALKSGALKMGTTDQGGLSITINNNYSAQYDPSTQGATNAGPQSSSGEQSPGQATPAQ
jgi:hypothetical protein